MHFIRSMLAALAALAAPVLLSASASAFENRVDARLLVETDRLDPGKSTRIALKLSPQQGWHVYWSNPGDSGMPPRITWSLPPKVKISDLRHPAPVAKDAAGFVSYVHPGDVSLLADLRIPASIPTGTTLPLVANVQWLTCSENMCVPERTQLTLDLVVGTGIGSRSSKDFDFIEQSLPRRLSNAGIMRRVGGTIEIEFANSVIDAATARLYPDDRTFDASSDQTARREGGKIIFSIASNKDLPEKFSGVITSRGAPRGFAVSARREIQAAAIEQVDNHSSELDTTNDRSVEPPPIVAEQGDLSPPETSSATDPLTSVSNKIRSDPGIAAAADASFLPAFFGALIGGLLLNLMPCVFPILSLKALSLARSGSSAYAARVEAFSYTAGAIIVCAGLGALLLVLRAAGGEIGWAFQLQNPYVILSLTALMAIITFNLVGMFELPSISIGGGLMMRDGAGGAFWTGALTAFIATPCSGPFMGLAIGAALVLPAPAALAVFIGLGLGLALPFLAIGTIPALRSRLPKPGPWMARLRGYLAIPMLLTAAALVWILGRQTGLGGYIIGAATFASTGFALCWIGHQQRRQFSLVAPIGALAVLMFAAAIALPTPQAIARVEASQSHKPFSEKELARLRNEGTPVFVDFTADWCLTCKVNDKIGIDTEATKNALQSAGVVTLVGDWTNSDPQISRFLAKHGRNSIPFYLYYAPGKPPVVLPQLLGPQTLSEVVKG